MVESVSGSGCTSVDSVICVGFVSAWLSAFGLSVGSVSFISDLAQADSLLLLMSLETCPGCAVCLGGDFGSTLSCVFWAELWVGLIILSKKPPEGPVVLAILDLGFGFGFGLSNGVESAGNEALIDLEGLVRDALRTFAVIGALFCRLGGRLTMASSPSCFAAEDAVDAIAAAGSFTGLVGDLGRVVGAAFFAGFEAVDADGVVFEVDDFLEATGAFEAVLSRSVTFRTGSFNCVGVLLGSSELSLERDFVESFLPGGSLGDFRPAVGVRGKAADLSVVFLLEL